MNEIVHRVEGLFALADPLEARFAEARGQVDALTPPANSSPKTPTDELAGKLLERIKNQ